MIPVSLVLENFMRHDRSDIDFTLLGPAILIVGNEDKSDRKSNAAGKTTIFKAIKFALFNAKSGAGKDGVIRRGTDKCVVTFTFKMSDGMVYRIIRSRAKNTSDVVLLQDGGKGWKDRTCRRASDTDRDVVSVIGMNLQTFENAIYFKQDDIFNLASTTPEKRKSIIKDMLLLSVWDKYRKMAVKSKELAEKELAAALSMIGRIGNPAAELETLKQSLKAADEATLSMRADILKLKKTADQNDRQLGRLEDLYKNESDIERQYTESLLYKNETDDNICFIKSSMSTLQEGLSAAEAELDQCESEAAAVAAQMGNLISSKQDVDEDAYEKTCMASAELSARIKEASALAKLLEKDLPEETFCPTCSSELDGPGRSKILQTRECRISDLEKSLEQMRAEKQEIDESIKNFNIIIDRNKKTANQVNELGNRLIALNSTAKNHKKNIPVLKSKTEKLELQLEKTEKSYESICCRHNEIMKLKVSMKDKSFSEEIESARQLSKQLHDKLLSKESAYSSMIAESAVLNERIANAEADLSELVLLVERKDKAEYRINVCTAGIFAFSSKGIPLMIINSVLDSIQSETNKVLSVLRNGLQVQFIINKEKSDGSVDDTLDMKFFEGTEEWEWEDLSGGQQGSVALALKFAMAVVSKNRCGTDVRLLMLDEVDQPLDEESLDSFYQIIKEWSRHMVIMVITHNKQLQSKFGNFIFVERTQKKSSASVIVR